ncbi:L-cysteine desulfidase [Halanaerobium sp. DL-01]|uniref:L-cysteine desulfidase family protein n=1 Tax=Halanaerobium sp. DL-01 TaxID=1653064 RepID=UPI000DF127E1|nr:L-serine ammonia-lyase, iron-sulfur-dependent, subunit alpha [Halanaerobium sp. DL-01]RCW84879.1 L-cysteine desulfidase [Halanaerobium sp. DL-01]
MKTDKITDLLKETIKPALGCTEPVAVAYALARAKDEINSEIEKVKIMVSLNIYKNAARVGIPGTNHKGPIMAAALSMVMGDYTKKLEVIEGVKEDDIRAAHKIIEREIIDLKIRDDISGLYIETQLITPEEKVRVIIADNHLNIVKIEKISRDSEFDKFEINNDDNDNADCKLINNYSFTDILDYVKNVPLENIKFLKDGVEMNLKVAEEGLEIKNSLSSKFRKFIDEEFLNDNMISEARMLASAASEARMTGSRLPIMSSAGSGNQGIVNFITNYAVAKHQNVSEEKLLRALALSNLITLYIKTATGSLSAMCGVAVAAGVGVSASTVYMLDGKKEEIFSSMLNVLGSVSGIVCDGAKEGCALKIATAVEWAVISAKLAVEGKSVDTKDGLLADNFKDLIDNLAYVCNPGMISTDQAMLKVMLNN